MKRRDGSVEGLIEEKNAIESVAAVEISAPSLGHDILRIRIIIRIRIVYCPNI